MPYACPIVPIETIKTSVHLIKDKTYPTSFKGSNVNMVNHKRQWINERKSKYEMYQSDKTL